MNLPKSVKHEFKHFFIPHPHTHKKAHLISWQAVLVYLLMFVVLRMGLDAYGTTHPGVLGVSSDINYQTVIELTNKERAKEGLAPLKENSMLNTAASKKAANMFEENYWAHYSPSGKDPWGFIQGAGYRFTYAGENLARSFYSPEDVVAAWMASPTHRANIMSPKFQEIGIAVSEGTLLGQRTTLIVQEFGTPYEALASNPAPPVTTQPVVATQPIQAVDLAAVPVETSNNTPQVLNAQSSGLLTFTVDPYIVLKSFAYSVLILIATLLLLDLYIIRRRAVYRITSRHVSHLALLGVAASAISVLGPGAIL
jgi:hypothetical protein